MQRPNITLVTTMKDEGPYILDWVAHYKSIGVQNIMVFTNDCTDPTDHILRILNAKGIVHHRFSRVMRRGPHKSALMWAGYEPVVREADWIFVADVDEYLQINAADGTLPGLLNSFPDIDAMSFVWRIFGNAGIDKIEDRPVPLQFLRTEPLEPGAKDLRMFKTIYKNCDKFSRLGVHRPFLADGPKGIRWVLPDGTPFSEEQVEGGLTLEGPWGYEGAQLNHYALRSLDAFINKKARGRANHQTHTIESGYWGRFDRNAVEDHTLADRFAGAEALKAEWLKDEELRDYHEQAVRKHMRKARRARKEPEVQEMLKDIQIYSNDIKAAE